MTAQAGEMWGSRGRPPHTREDTELFFLAFHAGNLLDSETLDERINLAGVRRLTDDYAPVDTLAFETTPVGEKIR